ncbi:MAG: hypothetical protein ISR52_04155 [Rhodospirillales bacterium]|nr:hypothetical protein [Rhodospirillales bacterium]
MSRSYEVYAFKSGNWNIDSVYDDRQQAMYEARVLLESRHLSGVQVIEENFDEDSGETFSKIIFQRTKGTEEPRKKAKAAEKATKASAAATVTKRKEKDDGFVRYIIILVLSVGGIGLGLIALLFFVMQSLG